MNRISFIKFQILCLLFSNLTIHAQQLEWQKSYGGSGMEWGGFSIVKTFDGGMIMTGESDSNDGDVSGNHGGQDYWVVKLDILGNIQWQRCYGGSADDFPISIIQTKDSGYAVMGWSSSVNGDVTGNHGLSDIWFLKLFNNGNIQWKKCYGGSMGEDGFGIEQTKDGGYIFCGSTFSNNGDVSGLHGNDRDCWVVKIDSIGNLQWQKCLGGTGQEFGYAVHQATDKNYFVYSHEISSDGDVSGNHGGGDYWIVKLDTTGTMLWQKCFGGSMYDMLYSGKLTSDGGSIMIGESSSNDGDLTFNNGLDDYWVVKTDSIGTMQWQKSLGGSNDERGFGIQPTSDGGYLALGSSTSHDGDVDFNYGLQDFWIVKLDSLGNILWQTNIGGSSTDDFLYDAVEINPDEFVMVGSTNSNNGYVTGNHGSWDFWVGKLTDKFNEINGQMFADFNFNTIKDSTDVPFSYQMISETPTNRFCFSKSGGAYNLFVFDTGSYVVSTPAINFYNPFPSVHNVTFTGIHKIDSLNNFAMQPLQGINDLSINITPVSVFRPGFNGTYNLNLKNNGTTQINASVVYYLIDTNSLFQFSDITPSSFTTDSIVWNNISLNPLQEKNIKVHVLVNTATNVGTQLNSLTSIYPMQNDTIQYNNIDSWKEFVVSSLDPNDKIVSDSLIILNQNVAPPYLDYVIRFQNTGTDTAFFVIVNDNISEKLNMSTFVLSAVSHQVKIDFEESSRLIKFTFKKILLPDSSTNEQASHGFIHYRLNPYDSISAGLINNCAAIYFDYNTPVLTNTVSTEFVSFAGFATNQDYQHSIVVAPNPAQDLLIIKTQSFNADKIQVYDLTGRIVYESKLRLNTENIRLNISGYNPGMYFINLQSKSEIKRTRFLKL